MQRYKQLILMCAVAKRNNQFVDPTYLNELAKVKSNYEQSSHLDLNNIWYKRLKYIFGEGEFI